MDGTPDTEADQDYQMAVVFRDACKTYGTGATSEAVLSHLSMGVPRGGIYGLLGASGSGKTTILGCIAGLLKLDAGEVKVLGVVPGTKGCGIPGSRIGYMPQEPALVDNMTVKNTLYYFGWMFGMRGEEISERYSFLTKLLDLPTDHSLNKDLSGGQQRRVSLAAALVQTPELLLLDEPTVGLDPVLRQSIWDYLVELSSTREMTIIITTHYIEEARQAHKIGFLREGVLLVEATPDHVIAQCNCSTLEEAYLLLSRQQTAQELTTTDLNREDDQKQGTRPHKAKSSSEEEEEGEEEEEEEEGEEEEEKEEEEEEKEVVLKIFRTVGFDAKDSEAVSKPRVVRPVATFYNRLMALLYKDFLSLLRNYPGLFFLFFMPVSLISLIFITLGQDGQHLPLGVVNDEIENCSEKIGYVRNSSGVEIYTRDAGWGTIGCRYHGLSCLYIDLLQASPVVALKFYPDLESALAAAKRTANQAVVYFPSNFSETLATRHDFPTKDDNVTTAHSEISAWIDMSDYVIGHQLKKHLLETYLELMQTVSEKCHINRNAFQLPVKVLEPVYGHTNQSYLDSLTPGILLVMVHTLSSTITAMVLLSDKLTGLWNRNLVAGATMSEVVLSHILCSIPGTCIQTCEAMLVAFYFFGLQCQGSLATIFLLICMQSLAGVSFGVFCSSLARNVMDVNTFVIAVLVPYSLLNGVIWPIAALPLVVQYISYVTPLTLTTIGCSNVIIKGFGLGHITVWPGLVAPLVWMVIYNAAAVRLLGRRW